jgi:hypothetical protein
MSACATTALRARPDADTVSGGRHRRTVTARERAGSAMEVAERFGRVITLGALLVLGTTVGGLSGGAPDRPVVTVTWGG